MAKARSKRKSAFTVSPKYTSEPFRGYQYLYGRTKRSALRTGHRFKPRESYKPRRPKGAPSLAWFDKPYRITKRAPVLAAPQKTTRRERVERAEPYYQSLLRAWDNYSPFSHCYKRKIRRKVIMAMTNGRGAAAPGPYKKWSDQRCK